MAKETIIPDLKEILAQENSTLNLEVQTKILVLKALIKSNFRVEKAFKINCRDPKTDTFYITYDTYYKMYRKFFPCGVKKLEQYYQEQFKKI